MNAFAVVSIACTFPLLALAQQGTWDEGFFDFGPSPLDRFAPVHLIHVFDGVTGRVVAVAEDVNPACDPVYASKVRLWTPPAPGGLLGFPGTFVNIPNCGNALFCGGHSALADGRYLHVGGTRIGHDGLGDPKANLFDPTAPVGSQWNTAEAPPDLNVGRFYPTATTLADGSVMAFSGEDEAGGTATIPEWYNPEDNTWTRVSSAGRLQRTYPYMFVLPDGNLVDAGPGESRVLRSSTWTWELDAIPEPTWPVPMPPTPGEGGSAVMYEPGKIMKCGGSPASGTTQDAAVASTFVLDMNATGEKKWMAASPLNRARRNHNLVVLPDGKVLAVGGNVVGFFNPTVSQPVFEAEIFDPAAGTWTIQPASDPTQPRWYHSSAMLLADGRVVSAGGENNPTAQVFNPPYITDGAPRPVITSAPSIMIYGGQYTIGYHNGGGKNPTRVCLIRLASVTHGFDHDQRRVPLEIAFSTDTNPGVLTVNAPANGNLAPPGHYMLFILSDYAVNKLAPCPMAVYVRVGP